jgi:hypothetical protein
MSLCISEIGLNIRIKKTSAISGVKITAIVEPPL